MVAVRTAKGTHYTKNTNASNQHKPSSTGQTDGTFNPTYKDGGQLHDEALKQSELYGNSYICFVINNFILLLPSLISLSRRFMSCLFEFNHVRLVFYDG